MDEDLGIRYLFFNDNYRYRIDYFEIEFLLLLIIIL